MDPSNPYNFRKSSPLRERFAARLTRYKDRVRAEAPGVAKRSAIRAGKGLASAGKEFARNTALNINSGQQQRHWDDLSDAIMGSRGGDHPQDVCDAIMGRGGMPPIPGMGARRSQRSRGSRHSTHIHIHTGGRRSRRGRRSQEDDPWGI